MPVDIYIPKAVYEKFVKYGVKFIRPIFRLDKTSHHQGLQTLSQNRVARLVEILGKYYNKIRLSLATVRSKVVRAYKPAARYETVNRTINSK